MFFRNLSFMRFPTSLDFSGLAELLPNVALKPVGSLEMSSRGFISPFGNEHLLVERADVILLSIGTEEKILPAAVVNAELGKRLAEIEEKEGRRPGGRERKRLKDDLLHELLPKALVRPGRVNALIFPELGLLAVDTSSRKAAEAVASDIRGALGSFPAMPINAEVAPRSVLTGWIAGEPVPYALSLGEEAELRDPVEGGAIVKARHQELRCDEIDKHLDAGKQVTRLAMTLEDHLSFVIGEDLVVRKLKFLDGALDELEDADAEDRSAELDARLALMAGELKRLFFVLEQVFKLSSVEG